MAQMIKPVLDAEVVLSALEARQHGGHDLVPMESLVDMEKRRKTRFDVHHAVPVHVLHHLVGHTSRASAVCITPQVWANPSRYNGRLPRWGRGKPPGEIVYVGGREAFVALLLREVDDGLRPQATIEMVVKDHLGQGPNERFVNLHH